ncbi:MAG: molybdopterin-synthase adenylyltransferase MoeB [Sphingopyxis sp.]
MPLSDAELDRYARHIVLPHIGGAGQARIKAARILIIGAGGIGSIVIPALAASGIGMMRVVDDDTVSLSNLQRQTLFATADIGRPKVTVAAERVAALNPHVMVETHALRVNATTIPPLLSGVDMVIDGSDNFATRLAVSDAATAAHVPLVSAAIAQFQGQVGSFTGWLADKPCYRCFVGDAHDPDANDTENCDSCAEQGVLGAMVAMVGGFAAMEALRLIVGYGEDAAGKLHVIDGLGPTWRTMRLPKDPGCRGCSGCG